MKLPISLRGSLHFLTVFGRYECILRAVDDRFVPHASVNSSLAKLGLDPDGMYSTIEQIISAKSGKDGMI